MIGFYINGKTVHYFPQGLENIFNNLRGILILQCNLKHITQSDFREYTNLVFLSLNGNEIEVLEEGLFDFNTNLKLINLGFNKISKVHPNVFDHLNQLIYLILLSNTCINNAAKNNASEVQKIIQQVKIQCPTPLASTTTVPPQSTTSEKAALIQSPDVAEHLKNYSKTRSHLLDLSDENEALKTLKQEIKSISGKIEQCSVDDVKLKIDQLRKELTDKMDEKIGNLGSKLDKILSFLDISN